MEIRLCCLRTLKFGKQDDLMLSTFQPVRVVTKWFVGLVARQISNNNWTLWNTIRGVVERVFLKSDERVVRGRFETRSLKT